MRRIYDIEDSMIAEMLGPASQHLLDIKVSTGKGGAFFVKNTKEPSILIKSITPGEYQVLKNFTANFYTHLLLHPDSLIAPILGIYTLSLMDNDDIEPISFILIKSVFNYKLVKPHQKMMFLDLKGSTEGRRTLPKSQVACLKDLRTCDPCLTKKVLKDNDCLDSFYTLGLKNTESLAKQISHDA